MRVRSTVRGLAVGAVAVALGACGGASETTSTASADYRILVGAGVQLLRSGNIGAAEQLFQQAIAKRPNDPVGYYDLGVAYQQQGQVRRARRAYRLAINRNPHYVPALFNEAVLISGYDKPTAIFLYRQVISIKPDSPSALLNLGLLEASQKGVERQAYRHLTGAIRLDPALRSAVPASLLTRLRKSASHKRPQRRR